MALYAGIFLVTLSGLMFEIGLTRIFSATIWYHFAFVAISVALLGWGLGGFALHLLRDRLAPTRERAAVLTLAYGLSIPLCLALIVRLPFHPSRIVFYFAVSLVPFFLAGVALSMVFAMGRNRAGQLYFADLLGASAGALLVTFLLSLVGGENAVLAVAIAPLAAAVCFWRRLLLPASAAAALVVALMVANATTGALTIRNAPTKAMFRHLAAHPAASVAMTGWNAYSRIDAVTGVEAPFLARLYIDCDAWTNVIAWDGRKESVTHLGRSYRALPFTLVPAQPEILVIGPGGGSDVLIALASGARHVTAVEMNPLMLRFSRAFGDKAGHLYDRPDVEAVLSEGRTFVRRTDRRFDVVLMGFVDSWAAVASGGLSLSENHLYTVEAFKDYYEHLTPDGLLTILRWDVDVPRLVTNAVTLLGPEEAGRRVAAFVERRSGDRENPSQMIFILKKRPFTAAELEQMAAWHEAVPLILPGHVQDGAYADLFAGRKGLPEFIAEAKERVDPVFDDRPFFFARTKPLGVPVAMSAALVLILVPLAALSLAMIWHGAPGVGGRARYVGSVTYFACLGLGFIGVELALLQHLTLLLGHPIFTLSILLFTLLAAGGLGSHMSGRLAPRLACTGVAALASLYALALPRVVPALLPLPLWSRIALAMALVAPLGWLMGMPFPLGLRASGRGPFPAAPFYWGLNGVFSVVGSIGTMVLALSAGFTTALFVGCACYAAAALASGVFEDAGESSAPDPRSA